MRNHLGHPITTKNIAEVISGVTPKYYPLRNDVPPLSKHTHGVMRTICGWCKLLDFFNGLIAQPDSYLQLELDIVSRLDTGQAQLPPVDPQEHVMKVGSHHVYLLCRRVEGGVRKRDEEEGVGKSPWVFSVSFLN